MKKKYYSKFCRLMCLAVAMILSSASALWAAPRINEIDPFNVGVISDSQGDSPDWIEIYNPDSGDFDLSGYFLTDDPDVLDKWAFPTNTVIPNSEPYLVVFLSGKTGITDELHASLSLNGDGEFLALVAPDGVTIVDSFSPTLPSIPERLSYGRDGAGYGYFTHPSPGEANGTNGTSASGFVAKPSFSYKRGHYDTPVTLTLSPPADTPGAEIRYTLDGSSPSSTTGILNTGDITISSTTVVRAIAYQSDQVASAVRTHTYLFAASSKNQTRANVLATGFPKSWQYINPTSSDLEIINIADYEMDPDVLNDSRYDVESALRALPSISLSLKKDHLFKPGRRFSETPSHGEDEEGIYVNPGGDWVGGKINGSRDAFERPASFEYIPGPGGTNDKQEDCGLRMQGLSSTRPQNYRKLSFRAIFRKSYGAAKLEHDVFPNIPSAVTSHNSLIMHGGSSDKWDHDIESPVHGIDEVRYLRDTFVRKMQSSAGGAQAPLSGWAHLYLNGSYWGVYNLLENMDTHWGAEYNGGNEHDYEVDGIEPFEQTRTVSALNLKAQLYDKGPVMDPVHYAEASSALEMRAFAEYMMTNQLALMQDWLINYDSISPVDPADGGWKLLCQGADQSMIAAPGEEAKRLDFRHFRTKDNDPFSYWDHLRVNPEFRELYSDLVQKHMVASDGVFTVANLQSSFQEEIDKIRIPLEAESARWGDAYGTLRTPIDNWEPLVNDTRDNYLPYIHSTMLSLYADRGLITTIPAPVPSIKSGLVSAGQTVSLTSPSGSPIYYTTDGSDPKTALDYTTSTILNSNSTWKRLRTTEEPPNWSSRTFNDNSWAQGLGVINLPVSNPQQTDYIRYRFNINNKTILDTIHNLVLTGSQHRASAVTFYVNGAEVVTEAGVGTNLAVGLNVDLSKANNNLVVGTNIIGVKQVRTTSIPSFTASFELEKVTTFILNAGSNVPAGALYVSLIPINVGSTTIKARARDVATGDWSALTELNFEIGSATGNLVISEFHYHPAEPTLASETSVSTDSDDYEFVEVMNVGSSALELTGYFFSAGITFDFPDGMMLAAGKKLLIVRDLDAFSARYPNATATIAGEYTGKLSNGGETVAISNTGGVVIEFTYEDQAPWPESADGGGPSLVLIDPSSEPNHNEPANWRLSSSTGGTPGTGGGSSLADWIQENNVTDLDADSDHDGLSNLAEFVFGSDPSSGKSMNPLTISRDAAGDLQLDVRVNPSALDEVELTIESSTDLFVWQDDSLLLSGDTLHDDGSVTYHYEILPAEQKRFYRATLKRR